MSLEDFAASFAKQYGVHPAFCERYLQDRYAQRITDDLPSFLASLSPTERLYLEYAFATNWRGRELLKKYPRHEAPRRVLDIGCGYGGTVRAFAEAGDETLGLEIDPTLTQYATLNLSDTPHATVRCQDIVHTDPATLGTFDLIFCSDVIEHVSNPDIVLDAVHRLLRPGGRFIMHVPNKDSIQQVLSDEHFCLFGFTLLSRQEGRELKRQMQNWDDPYHHMGQLLPLDYYLERLGGSRLSTQLDEPFPPNPQDAPVQLDEARARLRTALDDERLSWFTRRELAHAFARYESEFQREHSRLGAGADPVAFARRFVSPTWTIVAERNAASSLPQPHGQPDSTLIPTDVAQHNHEIESNLDSWKKKPLLHRIYRSMHEEIARAINHELDGALVELGSGIGNIKEVLPQCLRTDLFPNPWLDRTENAYSLSFSNESVSNVILFDVFHHLRYPGEALREVHRVLRPGGRVVIFEPGMGLLGKLVFGLFHHEPLGLNEQIAWSAPDGWRPDDVDYYAAQGNASRIFTLDQVGKTVGEFQVLDIKQYALLSYVASGGYSKPQLYPDSAYPLMRKLDSLLDRLPKLFATRMLVTLSKPAA